MNQLLAVQVLQRFGPLSKQTQGDQLSYANPWNTPKHSVLYTTSTSRVYSQFSCSPHVDVYYTLVADLQGLAR